jgi:N-acetylneuraminate synthase/N,N'-diacetyllegionaminate synthase
MRLIAEVGINHLGSMRMAKDLIDAGAAVGVTEFKSQLFNMQDMADLGLDESWQWWDYCRHCALTVEQHKELMEYCEEKGVLYYNSIFGKWGLEAAAELDMPIYKIPSQSLYTPEGEFTEMAKAVWATGKPVVSSLGRWKEGLPIPSEPNNVNLYCVSKYPTMREDISWPDFNKLGENGRPVHSGFSDHTIGTEIPKEAIDLGVSIIEKHFTLDKTLYGPDQAGSAEPHEMAEIARYFRGQ